MPPKEDPQAGQFDHKWGSKKAVDLIEKMRRFDEQRRAYAVAAAEFKELFAGHVEDAGLEAGARVRMGKYACDVVVRRGGGRSMREWTSLGRGQITLLE